VKAEDVKVILVLASWSSGSTSVAGYLDKCGAYSCPPHVHTVDERTPNAYEPEELKQVLGLCIDETTLEPTPRAAAFEPFFTGWIAKQRQKAAEAGHSFIVLKHPLQSFMLPVITKIVPNCRMIVVSRPFDKIEATRARRHWPVPYGEAGARIVYGMTYTWLHENNTGFLAVPYEKLRSDKGLRDEMLLYIGLTPTPQQRAAADAFIK
jgi:hypothetical protein